jgi:predicted AlkP superfamily phosphohydrolase/phosphomutase
MGRTATSSAGASTTRSSAPALRPKSSVFSETHGVGHQFQHHLDPTSPAHDPWRADALHGAVQKVYAALDDALGHVLRFCPSDTDVMIFSVHGLETQYATHSLLQPVLERLGFQVPAPSRRRDPLRVLRDRLPQWVRDRVNDVLPLSVQSELIGRFFEHGCDWARSRAVAEDSREGPPWIRINLRGREPWGIVEPGADHDALCAELIDELLRLRIHPGGQRAVREVRRINQMYSGPHLQSLPDLVVYWERGTAISRVAHPKAGIIAGKVRTVQRSQHTAQGFLIAAGARIRPAVRIDGHIMDLAPTIIYLMGGDVPSDMEGRVRTELIQAQFLAEHPISVREVCWDAEAWPEPVGRGWCGARADRLAEDVGQRAARGDHDWSPPVTLR